MKKFVLYTWATLLPALALCLPNPFEVLLDAPKLNSVSKGTYPNHIKVQYEHDTEKYPNAVKFEVARRKWLDSEGRKKTTWAVISKMNHTDTELLDNGSDKEPLILGTYYDYRVRLIWKGTDTSYWSNIDYGYIDRKAKHASVILSPNTTDSVLQWSPVEGAQAYRLQIVSADRGQRYNHDLERGFYNARFLKDTILTKNEYTWRGKEDIYWSVRVLNPQDSGYYAYPMRFSQAGAQPVYGNGARLDLFKWVNLNSDTLTVVVQDTTKRNFAIQVGIYGANQQGFDAKTALLLESVHLYLSDNKKYTINKNVKGLNYPYILIVPFQDGRAMMQEIEAIKRF